jgi:hypothetical protein
VFGEKNQVAFKSYMVEPVELLACTRDEAYLAGGGAFGRIYFCEARASTIVLYRKPESGKRWKRRELQFMPVGKKAIFKLHLRLKLGFGRFFRGACNRFWNVLLQKDT